MNNYESGLMSTSPIATMHIKTHNNTWMSDHAAPNCTKCNVAFGYLCRQHHCRSCGNIFCYSCASKYIEIPDYIADRPVPKDIKNPSHYFPSLKNKESRVCDSCYIMIVNKITAHDQVLELFANPVNIDELEDQPVEVADYYRLELRNIQYCLPDHMFSDIERKILLVNMKHLAGHSKYLCQLMKVIDYSDKGIVDELLNILSGEKIVSCEDLYCTGTCSGVMKFDDVINVLYSRVDVLPEPILDYLFELLGNMNAELILCGCTFFTNLIPQHAHIHKHIHKLIDNNITLLYRCYWHLSITAEASMPAQKKLIHAYLSNIDDSLHRQMHREYLFFSSLVDSLDQPGNFLEDNMKTPMHLPYDPSVILFSAYINEIEIKDSKTKPVIIPFDSSIGKIRLMFKRESVYNDHCVLGLAKVVNIILKAVIESDFDLTTYSVMPLTANAGIVEYVEEAETLHKLAKEKRSISQFLIDENDDDDAPAISKIKSNYICSLAGYTLLGYFLGLGDRHLQNVMITRRGSLFHIDFGYILGNNAYPLTGSELQFTCDMVEVIGGTNSKHYRKYLDYCTRGVKVLKKYFNMFYIVLAQHHSKELVNPFILERFQPRQADSIITKELMAIINGSHNNNDPIRDVIRYHTRDINVNKVVTGVSSALKIIGFIGLL